MNETRACKKIGKWDSFLAWANLGVCTFKFVDLRIGVQFSKTTSQYSRWIAATQRIVKQPVKILRVP